MEFGEKEIKKLSTIILFAGLAVLAFFLVKPVAISVISGLILAYIFMPLYKKMLVAVRYRSLTALIVIIIAALVIAIPLWILIPIIGNQIFEIFSISQSLNSASFVEKIFPTASPQLVGQLSVTATSIIATASATSLNGLVNFFLDLPTVLLHSFIIFFIFFYALRDSEELKRFVVDLSPLSKSKEKLMAQQFRDITNSIVYGQVIVGLVQGAFAGIGFLIFGVDNALILTLLATIFSIAPIIGPYIIWIPVAFYLFATGEGTSAPLLYLLYNLLIVSTVDNVIRSYMISQRSNISPSVILVGMLGGLFIFGLIGVLIGPLILAYFVTFLRYYKDKNIYTLFSDEDNKRESTVAAKNT